MRCGSLPRKIFAMREIAKGREGMKRALGKIPSGLFVLGAVREGQRRGMLCSFVEQAGFEPPMISLSLGKDRTFRRLLEDGGLFAVNILGEGDKKVLAAFASGREEDAFAKFELVENTQGLPQLSEALAWLACRVRGQVAAGDHVLYVAEVLDGCLHREADEPMIRLRKNGFNY